MGLFQESINHVHRGWCLGHRSAAATTTIYPSLPTCQVYLSYLFGSPNIYGRLSPGCSHCFLGVLSGVGGARRLKGMAVPAPARAVWLSFSLMGKLKIRKTMGLCPRVTQESKGQNQDVNSVLWEAMLRAG